MFFQGRGIGKMGGLLKECRLAIETTNGSGVEWASSTRLKSTRLGTREALPHFGYIKIQIKIWLPTHLKRFLKGWLLSFTDRRLVIRLIWVYYWRIKTKQAIILCNIKSFIQLTKHNQGLFYAHIRGIMIVVKEKKVWTKIYPTWSPQHSFVSRFQTITPFQNCLSMTGEVRFTTLGGWHGGRAVVVVIQYGLL